MSDALKTSSPDLAGVFIEKGGESMRQLYQLCKYAHPTGATQVEYFQ